MGKAKGHRKLNPDKEKVGCMVPICTASFCDMKRKSFCALRKYFLQNQKELRRAISGLPDLNHYVYYWRDDAKRAERVDTEGNQEAS